MIGAMLGPVFPLWILNVLHASVSRVFFIMAIMGAGTLALNVFAGHLTDVFGKRKLLMEFTFVLAAIRGVFYTFFPYVWVVIGTSWLTQLSTGASIFSVLVDKIRANGDEEREGIITSTVRTSVSIGYMLGPWLGIGLVSLVSYRIFFLCYAMLYLMLAVAVRVVVKDTKRINRKVKEKISIGRTIWMSGFTGLLIIFLFAGNLTGPSLLALMLNKVTTKWMLAAAFGIGPLLE